MDAFAIEYLPGIKKGQNESKASTKMGYMGQLVAD